MPCSNKYVLTNVEAGTDLPVSCAVFHIHIGNARRESIKKRTFFGSRCSEARHDGKYQVFLRLSNPERESIPRYLPPVTVYPSALKSSANSISIWAAASNGIGFKCS